MDKNGLEIAQDVLTTIGLTVKKISETTHRTADFFATSDEDAYLIEVKTKDDKNLIYKKLTENGPISQNRPIKPRNRMAAIIQDGIEQIEQTKEYNEDTFNLIWFHSTGLDSYIQAEQFNRSFYGLMDLAYKESNLKGITIRPCYGFTFAEAYNHKNLDGVFISRPEPDSISIALLVNPYSKKIDKFKKSRLYTHFDKSNGLIDPLKKEKEGEAFIVDDNMDIKNSDEVLKYIRKKYDNPNIELWEWNQVSVVMSVPNDL